MNSEMSRRLGQIAELHGRIREVTSRLKQDTRLLAELQQELSVAMEATWTTSPPQTAPPASAPPARMLRIADVVERVGLARATIYQMAKAGSFPQPRRLGVGATRWLSVEIDDWIRTRESTAEAALPTRTRRDRSGRQRE